MITYEEICKAILKKCGKKDIRPQIRKWNKIFEDFNVEGWSRDEFLNVMCKLKLRGGEGEATGH